MEWPGGSVGGNVKALSVPMQLSYSNLSTTFLNIAAKTYGGIVSAFSESYAEVNAAPTPNIVYPNTHISLVSPIPRMLIHGIRLRYPHRLIKKFFEPSLRARRRVFRTLPTICMYWEAAIKKQLGHLEADGASRLAKHIHMYIMYMHALMQLLNPGLISRISINS